MNRIEARIKTRDELERYVEVLVAKLEDTDFRSETMLDRIDRMLACSSAPTAAVEPPDAGRGRLTRDLGDLFRRYLPSRLTPQMAEAVRALLRDGRSANRKDRSRSGLGPRARRQTQEEGCPARANRPDTTNAACARPSCTRKRADLRGRTGAERIDPAPQDLLARYERELAKALVVEDQRARRKRDDDDLGHRTALIFPVLGWSMLRASDPTKMTHGRRVRRRADVSRRLSSAPNLQG
jgi:hypothetical protein